MNLTTRVSRLMVCYGAGAVLLLSLAASLSAQPELSASLDRIHIDNFGKVSDSYYRGAQPRRGDYADLAALGVRSVVDLTKDGRSDEQEWVEHAGMKFYRIPMTTTARPVETAIVQFLKLVSDPTNQPVYVHCQGGQHRTGVMTAVYRMTAEGWTADRAYTEMKQFNFETFPGHPTLKSFVFDYYSQIERSHSASLPSVATVAAK